MDIFMTKEGIVKEINQKNFENTTKRDYPYYDDKRKMKSPYFALCPYCRNPIKIINLYNDDYREKNTRIVKTHARHHKKDVPDLALYNERAYLSCIFSNPRAFGIEEINDNDRENNEILQLLQKKSLIIKQKIRSLVGINLSNNTLDKKIKAVINQEHYKYIYFNKYNLPFAILYSGEQINIFHQYINIHNKNGKIIATAILENSINYKVNEENQIVRKENSEFSRINLSCRDYHHGRYFEDCYFIAYIEETNDSHTIQLGKIRINIKSFIL